MIHRRGLYDLRDSGADAVEEATMTSPDQPTPTSPAAQDPDRPEDSGQSAWFDAIAVEHAAIYAYGMVSAHSLPLRNDLVSAAPA